jgi:hypothetical protein
VGLKAGLHDVEKRKIFTLPGLKLRPLGFQPVASRYTDCATVTHNIRSFYLQFLHESAATEIVCSHNNNTTYATGNVAQAPVYAIRKFNVIGDVHLAVPLQKLHSK